jgi:hypothetical protein
MAMVMKWLLATAAAVTVVDLALDTSMDYQLDAGECVAFKLAYDPASVEYEGSPSTGPNAGFKVELWRINGTFEYAAVSFETIWYEGASTDFLADPAGIKSCVSDFDDYGCWASFEDIGATSFKDGDCSLNMEHSTREGENRAGAALPGDYLGLSTVGSYDGAVACITAKQDLYVYVRADDDEGVSFTVSGNAEDYSLLCNLAANIMLVVIGFIVGVLLFICCCIACIYFLCCKKKA